MNYAVNLLELSGLNMLLALSVYATLKVGQFSLAQVGFWSIGAYLTGILTAMYAVPLLPALLVCAALCAVIGLLLGYPCLRIHGIYLTLATVAFGELVRVFFHNLEFTVLRNGVTVGPAGAMGFRGIPVLTTWVPILCAVLVMGAVFAWIERSRLGLAADAVREDETAAACAGIRVVWIKVGMFALGAAVAAVGGGLYATYTSFVNSDNFGFHMALISIFYVAVGGTGRFYGPIIGALVLTLLPELLRPLGDFRMVGYGAVVLVVMVFFPRGVADEIRARLGVKTRRRSAVSEVAVDAPSLSTAAKPGASP
jgi:branched-chain amino acid transport system permease protein